MSRKGQKINGISQSAPLTFGLRMNAHTFARVAHMNKNPKPDFPNIFCVLSLVGNSKWAPTAPVLDAPLRPSCGQPCLDGPSPPSNPHQTPPQNVFRAPIKIYFLHNIKHCCTNFFFLNYFLATIYQTTPSALGMSGRTQLLM